MEGFSIFHGGENIRVNNSDIDDEDELERHKSVQYFYYILMGESAWHLVTKEADAIIEISG